MEQDGAPLLAPDPGWIDRTESHDPLGLMGRRDFSLLIVDDSAGLREEVRKLVGRLNFISHCREAANGIEAYKRVLESAPDLILCDLVMPSVDGFKFLAMIRARSEFREVPIILLTGEADVETKVRGLELGASDYVTKPFDEGELVARVKVQLKIKALQDALRCSNERLRELSSVDPLTQLYNRRYFMRALAVEFERSERHDTPLSFVMMDLDHFKRVNDAYGHQAGDDVLRALGALIRGQIRATDIPGRYGGEEFCVLLPHTDVDGAKEYARRLRETVEATPFLVEGQELRLTASIGVSCCRGAGVDGGEDLIRFADEALYRAKAEGRNRVAVREP